MKPPFFVKPAVKKLFNGRVILDRSDWDSLIQYLTEEVECFVSPVRNFVSEYRVFVHSGKIIGAKHYHGDFRIAPYWTLIEQSVAAWKDAPVAYAADFGNVSGSGTLLFEGNDFYAPGSDGF